MSCFESTKTNGERFFLQFQTKSQARYGKNRTSLGNGNDIQNNTNDYLYSSHPLLLPFFGDRRATTNNRIRSGEDEGSSSSVSSSSSATTLDISVRR